MALLAAACAATVVCVLARLSLWCLVRQPDARALCETAAMTAAVLEDAGIVTWLCYGSLLGVHRDGARSASLVWHGVLVGEWRSAWTSAQAGT